MSNNNYSDYIVWHFLAAAYRTDYLLFSPQNIYISNLIGKKITFFIYFLRNSPETNCVKMFQSLFHRKQVENTNLYKKCSTRH